jgi:hypothetical protein
LPTQESLIKSLNPCVRVDELAEGATENHADAGLPEKDESLRQDLPVRRGVVVRDLAAKVLAFLRR